MSVGINVNEISNLLSDESTIDEEDNVLVPVFDSVSLQNHTSFQFIQDEDTEMQAFTLTSYDVDSDEPHLMSIALL